MGSQRKGKHASSESDALDPQHFRVWSFEDTAAPIFHPLLIAPRFERAFRGYLPAEDLEYTLFIVCSENLTHLLAEIRSGNSSASEQLLRLVYDELRRMAAAQMAKERLGHTLQPTALVHEAWLRLGGGVQNWQNRGHFFGAAAEAMRRVLVDLAREKARLKRGGDRRRTDFDRAEELAIKEAPEEVLEVDEALQLLERENAEAAEVLKLRYFSGHTQAEIVELLGKSKSTVQRLDKHATEFIYKVIQSQRNPG